MNRHDRITRVVLYAILIIISIIFLIPIVWMLVVAFKPSTAPVLTIREWFNFSNLTLENFRKILSNGQFTPLVWMMNSLIISSVSTVLIVILASLAAFGFSYYQFRGKSFWMLVIMAGMMIPSEATVIPLYTFMYNLGLLNTKAAIILPAMAMPMAFIILKNFFDGVPRELFESARIDGCNSFNIYLRIAVPLSRTAISSVAILAFISVWNDFLWPYISLYSQSKMTVPVGLMLYTSEAITERTEPLTAGALMSIPLLILFVALQKNIVKSVATTGIKG